MAGKKTKRQLADEAYLKGETLRGQLDAFDGVQGADTTKPIIHDDGAQPPFSCPHCGETMTVTAGGKWTHLKQWKPEDGWRLQCNDCGGIVTVAKEVWNEVRETAVQTFTDRPHHKAYRDHKGRERGAR